MSIIDERGRVLGRVNVVDAALVLLILTIIPIGYGSYLLFRDPPPRLTGLAPAVLNQGPNLQTEVQGENLRPYMRVSFGGQQGRNFLFRDPKTAVVPLPDLGPGKYDVVLFDYAREVARLPGALTIEAPQLPPRIHVTVAGAFTGLSTDQAALIKKDFRFPETGEPVAVVLETGQPLPGSLRLRAGNETLTIPTKGDNELPARLSLECGIEYGSDGILRCSTAGIPVAPDSYLRLPGMITGVNFRISDVHYSDRTEDVVLNVRFVPHVGVAPHVAAGDRDLGARAFPSGLMATLVSMGGRSGQTLEAVLRVPAEATPTGWVYKGRPIKVGAQFVFETATYTMDGYITAAQFPSSK